MLVGVQMVDISRLSAHPVPLTHRGLITVAGQGPKDSNGAGKSSFIAAISLLHADDQWRLAGGAPGAAELLFTAELAAQEARWANAEHGYVIGVFADPADATPAELEAGALTVWLRINRTSPYLSLRWHHGLLVPTGSNDAERAAGVHELWAALPSSNGRDDFHAGRLSSVLYGGRVRCVSFLSTSVRATVTEIVAIGRLPHQGWLGRPNERDRQIIQESLAVVGLADRASIDVSTLSGGQQRRVLIARALAAQPDVLIMDEPTAGVDLASQEVLSQVLARLAGRGTTMLIVTHELRALRGVLTRIVGLDGGRVIFDGTSAEHDRWHGALAAGTEAHVHDGHHDDDETSTASPAAGPLDHVDRLHGGARA